MQFSFFFKCLKNVFFNKEKCLNLKKQKGLIVVALDIIA